MDNKHEDSPKKPGAKDGQIGLSFCNIPGALKNCINHFLRKPK